MNKRVLINLTMFFILVVSLLSGNESNAQSFSRRPSWKEDFFSIGTKPLRDWYVLNLNYPSGNQFFTDSIGNVFVRGGYLHLRATLDKRADKVCSSGYVSTKGLKTFLFGKIEIRAKVPTGKGIFPGIWMLREDHGTAFPIGEIDIMEYIECFNKKEFAATIHLTNQELGVSNTPIKYTHSTQCELDVSKFHLYGLEWTPDKLTFTLDHEPYYSLKKSEAECWPFDVPYILILDVGYGGWGSQCGMDDTILPREMLIDWIRYYPLLSGN